MGAMPGVEEPGKLEEAVPGGRPLGVDEEPVVDNAPVAGGTPGVEEGEALVEDTLTTRGPPGDEELPEVGALLLEVVLLVGGVEVERVSIVEWALLVVRASAESLSGAERGSLGVEEGIRDRGN